MDYYKWNGMLRNYVRSNALCLIASDFDAKLRKIRHVAPPELASDAANKLYVENSIKTIRERQENIDKRLNSFQHEIHALQNEIRKILQYVQHTEILSTEVVEMEDAD